MRDLEEDAGTVSGVGLEAATATVLEVHEHAERIVHHPVGAFPLEVRERPDATRIVLELRPVQRSVHGPSFFQPKRRGLNDDSITIGEPPRKGRILRPRSQSGDTRDTQASRRRDFAVTGGQRARITPVQSSPRETGAQPPEFHAPDVVKRAGRWCSQWHRRRRLGPRSRNAKGGQP